MRCVQTHERKIEEEWFRGIVVPDYFARFLAEKNYQNQITTLFEIWTSGFVLKFHSPVHIWSKSFGVLKTD